MANKQLGVRIPQELSDAIDTKAEEINVPSSQLVVRSIEMIAGFAPETLNKIDKMKKMFRMNESELVQAVFLKWLAGFDASVEVYGSPDLKILPIKETTAETHYMYYKATAVKMYEKEVLETIKRSEAHNLPLSEVEKRIAIKYRIGKTWNESEEYKREQEIHAEIELFKREHGIPADYNPELDPDEVVTDEELAEWTKE